MNKNILDILKERGISPEEYNNILQQSGLQIEPIEEKPLEIEPIDPLINYAEPISSKEQETIAPNLPPMRKPSSIPSIEENPQVPMAGKDYEVGTAEEFNKALGQSNVDRFFADMAESGARIGSGLAGVISKSKAPEVDKEYYEGQRKKAQAPIAELESRIKLQDTDPNSAKSIAYRKYLKELGFPVSENASYASIKDLVPEASKHFDKQIEREFKQQENALRRAELGQRKEEVKSEKDSAEKDKFIERAAKNLSRPALDYQKAEEAARKARGIDPNNGIAQVVSLYEFIKNLDENSAVREGEISLVTSAGGLRDKAVTVLSKLKENPYLISPRVVEQIKSEISRLAKERTESYKIIRDVYLKQAKARGISDDRFGEIDPYYEQLNEQSKKDPKIEAYAKQYDLSYEKAEDIIRKRRYERK